MDRPMEGELILIPMELFIMGNGKMIYSMAMEWKCGRMALIIKEGMRMEKSQGKAKSDSLMDPLIREIFITICYMAKALTHESMERSTQAIELKTKCKEMAKLHGQMDESILDSISMIKSRDTEFLSERMERSMKESGLMGNRRERAFKYLSTERGSLLCGRRGKK